MRILRHRDWIPQLDLDRFTAATAILKWPVLIRVAEDEPGAIYYPVEVDTEDGWLHTIEVTAADLTPRELSRSIYRAIMEAAQWEVLGRFDGAAAEAYEDEDYNSRLVFIGRAV